MELKAKLVFARLLMYWIALNSCNEESGKKRERERQTDEADEADELGLMELKAKLVSRWAAYVLDCLKQLHQPRRKPEKRWCRV